jgi:predicted negative regulator of RcsB-dependent stress response
MKNVLIIVVILFLGVAGFLGWDWYDKTQRQELEPSITLYSWEDEKGDRHFSDTPPPQGAKNIQKTKGYKHL